VKLRDPFSQVPTEFLDAVTSDADRAVEMYASALRDRDDWKLRFKDRDAYARILEEEVLKRADRLIERAKTLGEQGAII
jgi:hypothetical protein